MSKEQREQLWQLLVDLQKPLDQGAAGERQAIVRLIEILLGNQDSGVRI